VVRGHDLVDLGMVEPGHALHRAEQ
jgi:hypothetical protein